jgi:hypothetical protein
MTIRSPRRALFVAFLAVAFLSVAFLAVTFFAVTFFNVTFFARDFPLDLLGVVFLAGTAHLLMLTAFPRLLP